MLRAVAPTRNVVRDGYGFGQLKEMRHQSGSLNKTGVELAGVPMYSLWVPSIHAGRRELSENPAMPVFTRRGCRIAGVGVRPYRRR